MHCRGGVIGPGDMKQHSGLRSNETNNFHEIFALPASHLCPPCDSVTLYLTQIFNAETSVVGNLYCSQRSAHRRLKFMSKDRVPLWPQCPLS